MSSPQYEVSLKIFSLKKYFRVIIKVSSLDLSLQSGHNLLAGLHHGVQLSRHHDGQALIFGQGQFQVGSGPVHDVNAHLRLVSLPELVDVLVLALL